MTIARPIMLHANRVKAIREGKQTHLTMAAWFKPGGRTAVGLEAKLEAERASGMRMPTPWTKLAPGDMLWVQEETAYLTDKRDSTGSRWFFRADLVGGHVPVPGGSRALRYDTGWVDASKLTRENSRYTLAIEGMRVMRAQQLGWAELDREGPRDPHMTIGAWWNSRYGAMLGDWKENPEVCALAFRFVDGNIDTGARWDVKARDWMQAASAPVYP